MYLSWFCCWLVVNQTQAPGGVKKRVMDDDMKDCLRQHARKRKSSAANIGKCLLGVDIKNLDVSHLASHQLASWRRWGSDPSIVLGIAYDAARFGYPQEETMLYALSDGEYASWAFCQVHHSYAN
jgi:hypothetical protein